MGQQATQQYYQHDSSDDEKLFDDVFGEGSEFQKNKQNHEILKLK